MCFLRALDPTLEKNRSPKNGRKIADYFGAARSADIATESSPRIITGYLTRSQTADRLTRLACVGGRCFALKRRQNKGTPVQLRDGPAAVSECVRTADSSPLLPGKRSNRPSPGPTRRPAAPSSRVRRPTNAVPRAPSRGTKVLERFVGFFRTPLIVG